MLKHGPPQLLKSLARALPGWSTTLMTATAPPVKECPGPWHGWGPLEDRMALWRHVLNGNLSSDFDVDQLRLTGGADVDKGRREALHQLRR